ncbi:helix-turn-helix domain-containing protein [Alkalihalobacillus sp. R86527]|uniref:helix-turn-helix domain-containing protein n=1 Tax=Alkalihalobacillus sp. R86527 TaxID=3093863 RepID=UPI00366A6E93
MIIFIFISIALHLVSFLCIVLLFLKQSKGSNLKEEVRESMQSYIEQLEHENDQLIDRVKTLVEKRESKIDLRLRILEQSRDKVVPEEDVPPREPPKEVQQYPKPGSVVLQHPSVRNDRKQQALKLYKEGFTINEIAKFLNCGVGEVELIVTIHGRSQQL